MPPQGLRPAISLQWTVSVSPHDSHSHVCLITPDESKPEVPSKPRRGALALTSNAEAPWCPGPKSTWDLTASCAQWLATTDRQT